MNDKVMDEWTYYEYNGCDMIKDVLLGRIAGYVHSISIIRIWCFTYDDCLVMKGCSYAIPNDLMTWLYKGLFSYDLYLELMLRKSLRDIKKGI